MKVRGVASLLLLFLLLGCAGPNPNIGERSTDYAWLRGNYSFAYQTVKPHAEAGEPWAQLRLALFYVQGWGVEKNMNLAVEWFEKAAAQKATGGWAEGLMLGAFGRTGYFNQNSDARIAQYKLAILYLEGNDVKKDLLKAYMNIRSVVEETKGADLFFCCEFDTPRSFPASDFAAIYKEVLRQMSPEQKAGAEKAYLEREKK